MLDFLIRPQQNAGVTLRKHFSERALARLTAQAAPWLRDSTVYTNYRAQTTSKL